MHAIGAVQERKRRLPPSTHALARPPPIDLDLGPVWFTTSVATVCLTFLPKVSYSIRTTNLRQSVAHLTTNQTGP
jgi:hypothetical protein